MLRVADIRLQLMAHLRRLGLHVSSALGDVYPGSEAVEALTRVRKSLTAGFFLNAAKLSDELVDINMPDADHAGRPVYRLVRGAGSEASRTRLRIHPSSVLFRCRPQWVCFTTAQQSNSGWYDMLNLIAIEPAWLTELAPHFYAQVPLDSHLR